MFSYLVRVPAPNAGAARARLAAALPDAQVTPADAASGEGEGGPSIIAIAGTLVGVLLLLFFVATFALGPFLSSQQSSPPAPQVVAAGKPIWVATVTDGSFPTEATGGAYVTRQGALIFNFKDAGEATVTFPEFAAPFMAIAVISSVPDADGTLAWRVRAVGERSVTVRVNVSSHTADLVYQDRASGVLEVLGRAVPLPDMTSPLQVAVLVRTPGYVVFLDGKPMIDVMETRLDTTSSALSMTATGTTGMIALIELRVHEAP